MIATAINGGGMTSLVETPQWEMLLMCVGFFFFLDQLYADVKVIARRGRIDVCRFV